MPSHIPIQNYKTPNSQIIEPRYQCQTANLQPMRSGINIYDRSNPATTINFSSRAFDRRDSNDHSLSTQKKVVIMRN